MSISFSKNLVSVRSLKEARSQYHMFDHVLTIEDVNCFDGLRISRTQLVLKFNDNDRLMSRSSTDGIESFVRKIIDFGRRSQSKSLLIHCHEGISRSTAAAFVILADRYGPGKEGVALFDLLAVRPQALCNRHILSAADKLLCRSGKLLETWDTYEATIEKHKFLVFGSQ